MGVTQQANCGKCGYSERLFVGSGILFDNLETVKKMFYETTAAEIGNFMERGGFSDFSARYAIGSCGVCNKLASILQITFSTDNGEKTVFSNPCSCGATSGDSYACPSQPSPAGGAATVAIMRKQGI